MWHSCFCLYRSVQFFPSPPLFFGLLLLVFTDFRSSVKNMWICGLVSLWLLPFLQLAVKKIVTITGCKELKWHWVFENNERCPLSVLLCGPFLSCSGQLFNQSAFYHHTVPYSAMRWWFWRTAHKHLCIGCIPIILHSAKPNTYANYWRILLTLWHKHITMNSA